MLRTNIDENKHEQDEHLKYISIAYNTSVHASTGYIPSELTFGKEANIPFAITVMFSLSRNELIKLWKLKYSKYLKNAKIIVQANRERKRPG